MPCLANSPTLCSTWQQPQIPRPPQTEAMSTPSFRAASRTVVPASNRPRLPDGVKMTSASSATSGSLPMAGSAADGGAGLDPGPTPVDAPAAGLALGPCDAELADPAGGVLVVALEHVGRHDRGPDALGDRVRDRARQARRDGHREEGPVDPLAVRQPEAHVAGAAGRVDLELVAKTAEDPEDLPARTRHRPDRHQERVDDHVLAGDAVVQRPLDDPLRDAEPDVGV